MARFLAALALALAAATAAPAQQDGLQASPILTIESERFFSQSLFGRRVAEDIEAAAEALAEENRRIEAELTAEEQDLTQRRDTMSPAAFREEADAFDARVQQIRREQDAKTRDVNRRGDAARRSFLNAARPVLAQLMAERGAGIVMERRSVFLSAQAIDITDEAIAAMDASIGRGATTQEMDVAPDQETSTDETPDDATPNAEAPAGGQD